MSERPFLDVVREELRKADDGRASEPWAVRELLAEVERLRDRLAEALGMDRVEFDEAEKEGQ